MLLMVVFLSKGTVSTYQEKVTEVEQSSEKQNKENSNQQINTIEFEATISIFSLQFLDFSDSRSSFPDANKVELNIRVIRIKQYLNISTPRFLQN